MHHLLDYIASSCKFGEDEFKEFKDYYIYLTLLSQESTKLWSEFHIPSDLCETNYEHNFKLKKAFQLFSSHHLDETASAMGDALIDLNYYLRISTNNYMNTSFDNSQGVSILGRDDFLSLAKGVPHGDCIAIVADEVYSDSKVNIISQEIDYLNQITQAEQYLNNFSLIKEYYIDHKQELLFQMEEEGFSRRSSFLSYMKKKLSDYQVQLNDQISNPTLKSIGTTMIKQDKFDVYPYLFLALQSDVSRFIDTLSHIDQ